MLTPTAADLQTATAAAASISATGANDRRLKEAFLTVIMAERERWQPAVAYFNAYCLDEAESAENCLEPAQHEAAKAFGAVIRGEA